MQYKSRLNDFVIPRRMPRGNEYSVGCSSDLITNRPAGTGHEACSVASRWQYNRFFLSDSRARARGGGRWSTEVTKRSIETAGERRIVQ
jgi:hypothetical protein